MKKLHFFVASALSLLATACGNNSDPNTNPVVGYLYTTTNGSGANTVLQLSRHSNGELSDEISYNTHSLGGANTAAGGDAAGDFDTQGALRIIDDYLLTVNAGGNKLSVFKVNKDNGALAFIENVSSGGKRPVSISFTPKIINGSKSATEYWVAVGNQWNNPNAQKDLVIIEHYPDDDGVLFFRDKDGTQVNLTQADPSDAERNLVLFSFNSELGILSQEKVLDTYVRENGGPTTVTFSDDGTKIAVSTWGIAHFATANPSLYEQHPSRIYVYDFNVINGAVSGERYFEEKGIAGSIGMNWAKNSDSILHVSNFNLTSEKRTDGNSLTILADNGTKVEKSDHRPTGNGSIDEACWTALSPSGDRLYVASFGDNIISSFSLNSDGTVKQSLGFKSRGDNPPLGDSKDMYITSDNKYLYNLGAFQTFSINTFKIDESGLTYLKQYVYHETKNSIGTPGAYNFLGLDGFTKK